MVKVKLDPIHYQSIDGNYYQELAQKILLGKPFLLDGLTNAKGYSFSPYPPGFPVLLALIQFLTGLPFSICAVLLHGFLLAGFLVLFRSSKWVGLILVAAFSDTGLELAANCWSEFSFLVLSFSFGFILVRSLEEGRNGDWALLGFVAGLCFLTRYSGLFLLPFLVWKIAFAKNLETRAMLLKALVVFLTIYSGWTLWQVHLTGLPTGGDRYPNSDSLSALTLDFLKETINQLLLFKNASGAGIWSIFAGLATQIALGIWIKKLGLKRVFKSENGFVFVQLGLFYLNFIVPIRCHFYFAESFDCRLLGPGFLLLLVGFGARFPKFQADFGPKRWLTVYILVATFFFLPKSSLVSLLNF